MLTDGEEAVEDVGEEVVEDVDEASGIVNHGKEKAFPKMWVIPLSESCELERRK